MSCECNGETKDFLIVRETHLGLGFCGIILSTTGKAIREGYVGKQRKPFVFHHKRDQLGMRDNEFSSGHTELETLMGH